jgi:4-hydroxythreonine-4-phosphate dehydrogenase
LSSTPPPVLALTQGDPAGIGPEIVLQTAAACDRTLWTPLLVGERSAFETVDSPVTRERLVFLDTPPSREGLAALGDRIPVLDPVGETRQIVPGTPGPADAAGAIAALDAALELTRSGSAQAMVTAPVSKATIARHVLPEFRGHTDYLARACGLERYGQDYLMAFVTPKLQVALLTVHQPLREALDAVDSETILAALRCLDRHAGGRIAVAGLNPHAGEGGLLGSEDEEIVRPAVEAACAAGLNAAGPESADSLFARAAGGEFDWVLALYHDQGLIAVKTAGFGQSVNWTLGLPVLRTSVDHGTAFEIAGRGLADSGPMQHAVEATLELLAGTLPRSTSSPAAC